MPYPEYENISVPDGHMCTDGVFNVTLWASSFSSNGTVKIHGYVNHIQNPVVGFDHVQINHVHEKRYSVTLELGDPISVPSIDRFTITLTNDGQVAEPQTIDHNPVLRLFTCYTDG